MLDGECSVAGIFYLASMKVDIGRKWSRLRGVRDDISSTIEIFIASGKNL